MNYFTTERLMENKIWLVLFHYTFIICIYLHVKQFFSTRYFMTIRSHRGNEKHNEITCLSRCLKTLTTMIRRQWHTNYCDDHLKDLLFKLDIFKRIHHPYKISGGSRSISKKEKKNYQRNCVISTFENIYIYAIVCLKLNLIISSSVLDCS